MTPIRFSRHVIGYMEKRGFTREEAELAIATQRWYPAQRNKLECRMEIPFEGFWNGKRYCFKRVRPIFVEEEAAIVVITVYTYYC